MKLRFKPLFVGCAAGIFAFAPFIGFFAGRGDPRTLPLAAAFSAIMGAAAAIQWRQNWRVWLILTAFGIFLGAAMSVDFYFGPDFEARPFVSAITAAFFAAAGFFVGAFGEMIRFFHDRLHRFAIRRTIAPPE